MTAAKKGLFNGQQPEREPVDRKLSNFRNEIPDLRDQGIHYRPLVWTADGRPHPTVARTLQYAADIASSRNGQQMSAKSLQRRWKHEIQIALLRRRAAMTRAVLPNPSARAEWPFAGIIECPSSRRWNWRPDTATPDDDDYIAAFFASQPTASLQPSSFQLCPPAPGGQFASFFF